MRKRTFSSAFWVLMALEVVHFLVRWALIRSPFFSEVDYDQAIPGLMALHILRGDTQIMLWGQPRMGSLQAYLTSFFFYLTGPSTISLHLSLLIVSGVLLLVVYDLGKKVGGERVGIIAAAYWALPPIFLSFTGNYAGGGHLEAVLLGSFFLLGACLVTSRPSKHPVWLLSGWLGLLAGIGGWSSLLIIPFILAGVLGIVANRPRLLWSSMPLMGSAGFLLGSLPFWVWNYFHDFDTLIHLGGESLMSVIRQFPIVGTVTSERPSTLSVTSIPIDQSMLLIVVAKTTGNTKGRCSRRVSSNGGVNFWIGNNPDYQAMVDIRPKLEWQRLVDEPRRAGVYGEAAESRFFVRKALAWAKSHPWAFLRLQAHKLRLLLSGNEIYRNQAIYPARQYSPILAVLLWKVPGVAFPFGLLMPLGVLGLWVGTRRAPLLAVIVLALAFMVQLFFVTARYRILFVPFLLIFAAEGGRWLVHTAHRRQKIIAGLAVLALFLLANLGQGPMDRRMNPDAEYSLAVRLGERGHMKEAQALFESVVAAHPGYAEAWLNLAVCYDEAGRPSDAEAALRRALHLDRDAVKLLQSFMRQGKPEVVRKLLEHVRAITAGQR